ncbi:hypothetical protein D3C86_1916540 [compost metagenome]
MPRRNHRANRPVPACGHAEGGHLGQVVAEPEVGTALLHRGDNAVHRQVRHAYGNARVLLAEVVDERGHQRAGQPGGGGHGDHAAPRALDLGDARLERIVLA